MNRNKRTAILSWVFNCGEGAWQKSMLRKLVLEKAPMEKVTQRWTSKYLTAQGSSKPILKPRRIREVTLYYTP
jgi:GH24 family phage-related lysozyme (muramidase)